MLTNPKEYLARARREGWALGGFNFYDLESARAAIAAGAAEKAPLLVQTSEGAVDAGYTSAMIVASRQTFDENLRETADIVKYAHAHGVHVEAELGTRGGISDGKA